MVLTQLWTMLPICICLIMGFGYLIAATRQRQYLNHHCNTALKWFALGWLLNLLVSMSRWCS